MKLLLLILYSFLIFPACTSTNKKTNLLKRTNQKQNSQTKNMVPFIKSRVFVFKHTNTSEYKQDDIKKLLDDVFYSKILNLKNVLIFDSVSIKDLSRFEDIDKNIIEAEAILEKNDIFTYIQGNIEQFVLEKEESKKGLIRVENIKVLITLNIKIHDIKNKAIIFDKTITANDSYTNKKLFTSTENNLEAYDEKFLKKLVSDVFDKVFPLISISLSKQSWTGRIAKIDFSKVYINSGRRSGVKVGDLLKVVDTSEAIYDPQNEKLIGIAPGRVKGTIQVEEFFGDDGSITSIHTGGGFRIGDKVELY